MKILNQGKNLKAPNPLWWVGKTVRCKKCGCTFVLEDSDKTKVTTLAETDTTARHCEMLCPNDTCNSVLWFYPPGTDMFDDVDRSLESVADRLNRKLEELQRRTGLSSEGVWTIFGT